MFAQDGKQIYHAFPYPAAKLHAKWIPIIFKMDIPNDRINISIGNDQVTIEEIGLNKRTFTPQLFSVCAITFWKQPLSPSVT